MDAVKFGQRVRQARMDAHCTRADLGKHLGLTSAFIGRIERGTRMMSVESMLQLCRVLHVSPEALLIDGLTFLSNRQKPDAPQ